MTFGRLRAIKIIPNLLRCAIMPLTSHIRPKVLVTHWDVPKAGIDLLREKCDVTVCEGTPTPTRAEILEKSKGMDGIFWGTYDSLNVEVLDAAGPQLRSISVMTVGLDYVDVPEMKRRNIPIGYTPAILNDAVADLTIGLMISAARRFHEGRLKIIDGEWELRPQFLLGQEICRSTVGIVGFGQIGQTIAKRLTGFDVSKILYSGHSIKPEAKKYEADFVTFDELLEKSDFVIMSAPLTNETRGMFNERAFNKMKPTSVFVNIARGGVVNQDDLYDALHTNKIFAAAIDVMTPEPLPSDHKILSLPNLIIVPHLGSSAIRTTNDMSILAAHNILKGLAGEAMPSPVP